MNRLMKKHISVHLSLEELTAETIGRHIKTARDKGYDSINFIFGGITRVSFTIEDLRGKEK